MTLAPSTPRAGIPHHLIDILDPLDPGAEYSAGDFHDAAHATVADVLSRGATPIVIGGTGFYLRTFMCGKPHGGKAPPGVERRVRTLITAALYEALADSPAELAAADGAAGTLAPPGRIASGEAPAAEDGGDPEAGPHSPRGAPVDAATLATGMVEAAVRAARHGAGGAAADALEERLWLAGVELLRRAGDADGATRCVPAAGLATACSRHMHAAGTEPHAVGTAGWCGGRCCLAHAHTGLCCSVRTRSARGCAEAAPCCQEARSSLPPLRIQCLGRAEPALDSRGMMCSLLPSPHSGIPAPAHRTVPV